MTKPSFARRCRRHLSRPCSFSVNYGSSMASLSTTYVKSYSCRSARSIKRLAACRQAITTRICTLLYQNKCAIRRRTLRNSCNLLYQNKRAIERQSLDRIKSTTISMTTEKKSKTGRETRRSRQFYEVGNARMKPSHISGSTNNLTATAANKMS